jgi:hypothetical protein
MLSGQYSTLPVGIPTAVNALNPYLLLCYSKVRWKIANFSLVLSKVTPYSLFLRYNNFLLLGKIQKMR